MFTKPAKKERSVMFYYYCYYYYYYYCYYYYYYSPTLFFFLYSVLMPNIVTVLILWQSFIWKELCPLHTVLWSQGGLGCFARLTWWPETHALVDTYNQAFVKVSVTLQFLGTIALSYPPKVRVRATVKLSAAFFHDESSITTGGVQKCMQ